MKGSWVRWLNYGVALSVLLINLGFLLPVTFRELKNNIPYKDNMVLMQTFNCNLMMIPAIISLLKRYASSGGWLAGNLVALLVCIYVYFVLIITVNAV